MRVVAHRWRVRARALPVSTPDPVRDVPGSLPIRALEVSTAVAFEIFKRAAVDVAVVEVGLGGRFDATNVLTPTIAAITSIAFDHEKHLGHTLSQIAFEKAGIAKRGVPLVIGRLPREAEARITKVAKEVEAPIVDAHATTTDRKYPPLTLSLPGRHQLENAAVILPTDGRAPMVISDQESGNDWLPEIRPVENSWGESMAQAAE